MRHDRASDSVCLQLCRLADLVRPAGGVLTTMNSVNPKAKAFITAVCLSAIAIVAVLVQSLGWTYGVPQTEVVAVLTLALLAELLADKLPAGGGGSVAFVPLIAAIIVNPTPATALVGVCCTGIAQLVRRRPPERMLFNTAQSAVGLCLAVAVFVAIGGRPFDEIQRSDVGSAIRFFVVPGIVLTLVLNLTNSMLVSVVLSLTTDRSVLKIWRANTLITLRHMLVAVPATFGVAWIAIKGDALGIAVLGVPLLGIRGLYKTTYDLQQVNEELLELMIKAIEARDPYTSGHSRRVSATSRLIAQSLSLPDPVVEKIAVAALLHDVGKIHEAFAPILSKPGRLTEEEWAIMKTHPARGAELVATISHLKHAVPSVRGHHENWNGTGYPDGLAGEKIPLGARIITVADTIDALVTDRPYRSALSPQDVRAELVRCRGSQFDPTVCDAVLSADTWRLVFPSSVDSQGTVPITRRQRRAGLGTG